MIRLKGDFTVEILHHERQSRIRGLGANGSRILNNSFMEIQIHETPALEDAVALRNAFLNKVYLYVDYNVGAFKPANINDQATIPLIVSGGEDCGASAGLSWESNWPDH